MALWNMWWNCCSQIASELIWTFGHTWACLATLWEILGEMLSFSDNLSKYKQSMRSIDSIWRHNWSHSSYNSRKIYFPRYGLCLAKSQRNSPKIFRFKCPFHNKEICPNTNNPWDQLIPSGDTTDHTLAITPEKEFSQIWALLGKISMEFSKKLSIQTPLS